MSREVRLFLITSFWLVVFASESIKAQDINQLNNFKYVVVETLVDDDMDVDKYQISSMVRRSFIEKGFVVINENKQSWPSELFNDPCLGLYCDIALHAGLMAKYRVELEFTDCNKEIRYAKMGKANGETDKEAFQNAAKAALKEVDRFPYVFNGGIAIEKKSGENYTANPLLGLFESTGEDEGLTILITQVEDSYEAKVESSDLKEYKNGRLVGRFTESTIAENIYNVEWISVKNESFSTIAKLEEGFRLVVELNRKGEEKVLVFRKMQ
jgi:hypothetical protein